MLQTFATRQFKAGNSQAVRIPSELAFPPQTELRVMREGNRIIVEPLEQTLDDVPMLFAALAPHALEADFKRPEFVETERAW